MKIILGSKSEIKRQAVEDACRELGIEFELICVDVSSGVNSQPVGDEAGKGARNRALAARKLHPGAYAIGIENGILEIGDFEDKWVDRAVLGVITPDGYELSAVTPQVVVPSMAVNESRSMAWGITIGEVLASMHDGCDPQAPHSFLTEGKLSRRGMLAQALVKLFHDAIPRRGMHRIQIGEVVRYLPIREVAPEIRVALFNLLGDWKLAEAAGTELAKRIPEGIEALLMPDGKAQALLHVMGRVSKLPTFVARKERKPYMADPVVSVSLKSITTDRVQELFLGAEDVAHLRGKRIAFVDDVVSTGGTLKALDALAKKIDAIPAATLAIFTEGKPREDVISLGHLPMF